MGESLFVVIFPGALALAALVTLTFILVHRRLLLRELGDGAAFLAGMRGERAAGALVRAIREHLIEGSGAAGRYTLSRPLPALRREYAEDELAHRWAFWFGGLLTGIALIATFLLIGHVMTTEVSGAIRESVAAGDGASLHLSQAVTSLGGKFYISAAGIGGSVLALLFSNWARAGVYRAAEHPGAELLAAFTSVEAQQLTLGEQQLAFGARQLELLASVDARIQALGSIEVSVKAIGNEVSANLKNIMKDAMGEQLKGMLADTMVEVNTIAERVQQGLSASFGEQLAGLTQGVQASLAALQQTVASQGQGQLEQILGKLQDTVSGGFHSESVRMTAVLERLTQAIPELEQQLRAMTGQLAEETRQRDEERARLTQEMLAKMGALLEALGAQQAASAQAIERMQVTAEQGAEGMARRLEESGASVVNGVLAASRGQLDELMQALQAAADRSASSYGDLEARAGKAAASVAEAAEGLTRSTRALLEMSGQTAAVIAQAKAGNEAGAAASQTFLQAGASLAEAVRGARAAVEEMKAQTQAQQTLLGHQHAHTREAERIWPTLFTTYLAQLKASADELGRSWEDFYKKVGEASRSVGAEFAESAEILSSSVDRLVKLTGKSGAPA